MSGASQGRSAPLIAQAARSTIAEAPHTVPLASGNPQAHAVESPRRASARVAAGTGAAKSHACSRAAPLCAPAH